MERPEQPDIPEVTPASGGQVSPHAQPLELVYDELRDLASRYLTRERPGHTLQPTALVHEAFLRIREISEIQWRNQAHFFAFAAPTPRTLIAIVCSPT